MPANLASLLHTVRGIFHEIDELVKRKTKCAFLREDNPTSSGRTLSIQGLPCVYFVVEY